MNTTFGGKAGGMSGGPWFQGNGLVGSLNKVELPGSGGTGFGGLAGAYLDSAAKAGYTAAGGRATQRQGEPGT